MLATGIMLPASGAQGQGIAEHVVQGSSKYFEEAALKIA